MGSKQKKIILLAICLALFVFSLAIPAPRNADRPALELSGNIFSGEEIGLYCAVFEDPTGRLSFQEISSRPYRTAFIRSDKRSLLFGFVDRTFWIRLTVANSSKTPLRWSLMADYPSIDEIELIDQNGISLSGKMGRRHPYHHRLVDHESYIFPLAEQPGDKDYYLRIRHCGALVVPLRAWSAAPLERYMNLTQNMASAFYGIMLAMFCYHILVFFTVRKSGYLYYSFIILLVSAVAAISDGFAAHHIWPQSPSWNHSITSIWALAIMAVVLFIRQDAINAFSCRMINGIFMVLLGGTLCLFISSLFAPFLINLIALSVFTVLTGLIMITLSLFLFLRRYWIIRFTAIAFIVLFFVVMLRSLNLMGVIPNNFITIRGYYIGLIAMVVLFSLAMGDRINLLNRHLTQLNRRLENEVKRLRYEKSRITGLDVDGIVQDLQRLMDEDKIFCDEDCSLNKLASHLSIEPYQLSQIINERLGKNFNSFINEYRIREAQQYLIIDQKRTVYSIADAVGFSNLTTFNHWFRTITGITPQKYRRLNREQP